MLYGVTVAGMAQVIVPCFILAILHTSWAADGPLVTLKHGGKVRGLSYVFRYKTVDHFLGKLPVSICRVYES